MRKRKYTVTAKVLAAVRANLIKANAVSKEIRYRSTPRRLRACRLNLLQAQVAVRALDGRSPAYATCFRHGLYCVSLARSLERAGESRREYRAHLRRFDQALAPVGRIETKLVRALAGTAWRHWRALHGQARWERAAVAHLLSDFRRGEPPDELWPLSPADRHQQLVEGILQVLETDTALDRSLHKLDERFERLLRVWLEHGSSPDPDFQFFTAPGARDTQLLGRTVAALTNPFLPPRRVAQALKSRSPAVRGTRHWDWIVRDDDNDNYEPGLDALFDSCKHVPGRKAFRFGLLRGSNLEAGDFAGFERLFAAAFEASDGSGGASPEVRAAAETLWARLEAYDLEAKQQAERLKQALEAPFRAGALDSRRRQARRRELAQRLLAVFSHDEATVGSAAQLEFRVQEGFYNLLTTRYGKLARFAHLSPKQDLVEKVDRIQRQRSYLLKFSRLFRHPSLGRSPPPRSKTEAAGRKPTKVRR